VWNRQFVFGGYSVVSSVALSSDADPAVFSFLRDLFASPFLFLAAWYFERLPRLQPEHAFTFVLLGATGIYGNQLFYILGLNYTSALNAALLQVPHTHTQRERDRGDVPTPIHADRRTDRRAHTRAQT
jgi:drug/metabolite transporter (DMT)-like permease